MHKNRRFKKISVVTAILVGSAFLAPNAALAVDDSTENSQDSITPVADQIAINGESCNQTDEGIHSELYRLFRKVQIGLIK